MANTRVSIVRAEAPRDRAAVGRAVREAVELAGGLEGVVSRGDRVLLKPNLVATPPTPTSGACTSAAVCRALADVVRDAGGHPFIAESSARGIDTEEVMRFMGFSALRDEGYEVVDLKRTPVVHVPVPNGAVLEQVATWQPVLDADAIISVPVMKTHDQTDTTLSMKNLKGLVTDSDKRRIHQLGVFEGVCDLVALFRPAFALVDGIIAQEGLGPVYGLPVEMGLVLAGRQALATDAVASAVMGFDPGEIILLRTAQEWGLGTLALDEIVVAGEAIEAVRRRFMRMEEDERVASLDVTILHDEGSCTGCRNGVLSSLFDMIQDGSIGRASGMTIVTGGALPPEGTPQEKVVAVGVCCPKALRAWSVYVPGCPPNNVDIVSAILRKN